MHGERTRDHPKVIVIGMDGATFNLIVPWAQEGKLPHMARLLKEGAHGYLESTIPPVTPPAWSSFMTGKNPGKHGIFHFIGMDPESYDVHYINARSRRSQTIWKVFNEAQRTVGVLNVPFTFPPESVDGYMMSGMDTPDEQSDFLRPASLREELEERVGKLRLDIRYLGYMTSNERRDAVLQGLREIDEQRTATALYLMERRPTDLMMIVYTSTDTVGHYFWHYMDPEHPFFDAQGAERYGRAILEVYQRLDQSIGEFLARLPEETAVVLVSDHGNGPTSERVLYLNRYLAQLGLLKFQSDGTGRGRLNRMVQALVKRLDLFLRGNLSAQQKVKLAQRFPTLRRKWESYYSSTASVDWAATKAYGVEILASPPAIHINLKGVKPQGTVEREEYSDLVEFLIKRLYELKDPKTGRQLITKVYRREEIYHGPYAERGPDLTLAWWEDGTFNAKPSAPGEEGCPAVTGVQKTDGLKSEWSGNHLLHGILLLKGNPFRPGLTLEGARIIDMAPTLLYLLGVPIPEDMDGRVLKEAFTEDFLAAHLVQFQKGDEAGDQGSGSTYSEEEAALVEERLKSLGYLQ